MHMIVLRHLNRLSPDYDDGSELAPCLDRLTPQKFADFCSDVRGDFWSGGISRMRKYGISDLEKVFKSWNWSQEINIGIVVDFQSYGYHAPLCQRLLLEPEYFFSEQYNMFQVPAGKDGFFSSGAIVVHRE